MMPLPKSTVKKRINGVMFEFDFDLDRAADESMIGAMYRGIYEPRTVAALQRFLKKGDTFIDVGAHVGYISAIGLGFVGPTGRVHSFEPVPQYFEKLSKFQSMNSDYEIHTNPYALGEHEGTAEMVLYGTENIGWNSLFPELMPNQQARARIEVRVRRLDDYLTEHEVRNISLIKIDTEGFEFPVLFGMKDYLESTERLPVIICEVSPWAFGLGGHTVSEAASYLKKYGYRAYDMANTRDEIDIAAVKDRTDVLLLPLA